MRREVLATDLEKKYGANDMARVDCGGCIGCSECCRGMGQSIILDPYDVHSLCRGLFVNFAELMREFLELNVVDGVILPNLRMQGPQERCPFLNGEERCSIHTFRPGVCRMFPLGRVYGQGSFSYFLQSRECRMEPKRKIKISKWLDIPGLKQYERYVLSWHDFLEDVRGFLEGQDERTVRDMNVYLVQTVFEKPYGGEDFYSELELRLAQIRKLIAVMKNSQI